MPTRCDVFGPRQAAVFTERYMLSTKQQLAGERGGAFSSWRDRQSSQELVQTKEIS